MEFIKLTGVCKSFKAGKRLFSVLKNVDLSINQGEFVVILGASGSGKTTLLNLIAGLDKPEKGEIVVDGTDITQLSIDKLSAWRAENIGVIFQSYNLMPYMSALNNVALPLIFQGVNKKTRIKKANAMLQTVGLKCLSQHACQLLSGGEQQRVTIARALINNPKLLIADEPTGDLDSKNAEDILDIIYALYKERETTILMATHNNQYTRFADKVINVIDGKVVSYDR